MSHFPSLSVGGEAVPASIFAKLREHLAKFPGDVIPLQIGDTHLPPPAALAASVASMSSADLYAYGNPQGLPALIDALADKARRDNGIATATAAGVQIACGATHALACAVQALCDPGDELVLLSPHWPLIRGMALAQNVVPVEAELAALERAITANTVAIYYATPNNPDGAVLGDAALDRIARLAERHGLWVIADEVYEHYAYGGGGHRSIAARIPERTVTVFSFAKSYAQAGLRIGYAVAPVGVAGALKKLVNHSVYNVPAILQHAALGALREGNAWLADARVLYRAARDQAAARLRAPAAIPDGGAYLWVDLRAWGADCMPVLEQCAAAGVLLAPGSAFGAAYCGFARLCFTGVPAARLEEGIDRVNAVLAES